MMTALVRSYKCLLTAFMHRETWLCVNKYLQFKKTVAENDKQQGYIRYL